MAAVGGVGAARPGDAVGAKLGGPDHLAVDGDGGRAAALQACALRALGAASLLAVGTVLATANPVLQSLHDEIAVVEADVVTDLTE